MSDRSRGSSKPSEGEQTSAHTRAPRDGRRGIVSASLARVARAGLQVAMWGLLARERSRREKTHDEKQSVRAEGACVGRRLVIG